MKKGYVMTLLMAAFSLFGVNGETAKGNKEMTDPPETGRKYIPYTLPWDDMPIDLSFIYADEKPAGKHGFLQVEGDKFIFEDGTEARFWGTNFNSSQNFPSHEHSEKLAKRLGKIGINLVRFHQLDAEWSTPNIFQFTKGENKPNTLSFDPESMDRLDYLIHCLKEEGIYMYMDLLTYRRFKTGDGVEAADQLPDAAKPYTTYSRKLIELQKKFNYDLWTHINPYTKLAYKDDPAIVLSEVANENDLWSKPPKIEPYVTELEGLYREWAKERKIKVGKGKVEFDPSDKNIESFFIDVNKEYYKEMIAHMRETGVRIPITGTNWSKNAALLESQMVTDFTDTHAYLRHRKNSRGEFTNQSMTAELNSPVLPNLSFFRVHDKPFFVSEWDNSWPNEWRAESSLLLAAIGVFQGWGGYAIHTYRYSLDENVDMIAKPITSNAIGGISYRAGLFDTFNDPAKFGLFYHAALITRRGDVKPAGKTAVVKINDLSTSMRPKPTVNALDLITEKHRVGVALPDSPPVKADIVLQQDEVIEEVKKREVLSDTKELYRNLDKKIGWIDSPNTKAVYGFVGEQGEITLNNLKINAKTDFATIALSTLTDDPISNSENMLLTTVGRADNTNAEYNEDHTLHIEVGHGPILVEVIEATIEITTDVKNLRVMAINPQGVVIGYVPSEYKDGKFSFETGKHFPSMYYLIQAL